MRYPAYESHATKRRFPIAVITAACLIVGAVGATALIFEWGCAMPAMNADFGVTTGGQQDIAAARRTIETGGIPHPDSITVEGMLSEHSIPIEQPQDAPMIYASVTTAWGADFDAFTPLATVQIGFGTTIDTDNFSRSAQNLCLVIDQSGSMDDPIDQRTGASKLDAVKVAVDRLLAQLTSDDIVSVVAFDLWSYRLVDGAAGDDVATIKSALDDIVAEGRTNLAAGVRRGFDTVARHTASSRADRVILFTDAQPTWGTSDADDFVDAMERYADEDTGVTVFGVGVDLGHELANEISQIRGGNYFFLSDYDRIVTVFDDEFDYLVTPVAYDVRLVASIPFEFDVANVYGIPEQEELTHTLELEIPTLFLSNRQGGGAVFVRLRVGALVDMAQANRLADLSLSFTTPEGETVTQTPMEAMLPSDLDPDGVEGYYENDATRRGVLLLNTALVLKAACDDMVTDWGYVSYRDSDLAIARLTEFLPYFDALAEGLEDRATDTSRSLSQERALVAQLLENITGDWR